MPRFSHNLLSVSYLGARVCASSMFIIDIADKLLGSDWMCLMSCRCESQQMKMGFCIGTTAETPDRWRQMVGVSYCLTLTAARMLFQYLIHTHTHAHIPVSLLLCLNSLTKLCNITKYFICHAVVIQQPIAIHTCVLHTHQR